MRPPLDMISTVLGSPTNPYFIVHDCQGFEYRAHDKQQIVLDFIKDRAKKPLLKDQLHAIWLCVAVPFANARAFEAGDIEILRLQADVPIIVIFTKYDKLVDRIVCDVEDEHAEWDKEGVCKEAQSLAIPKREELCENPLHLASPNDLPHPHPFIYVSSIAYCFIQNVCTL